MVSGLWSCDGILSSSGNSSSSRSSSCGSGGTGGDPVSVDDGHQLHANMIKIYQP